MAIRIRDQQDDDLPGLLVIWWAVVEASHGFLTPDDIDWYESLSPVTYRA